VVVCGSTYFFGLDILSIELIENKVDTRFDFHTQKLRNIKANTGHTETILPTTILPCKEPAP
jgi:hypothetical protein